MSYKLNNNYRKKTVYLDFLKRISLILAIAITTLLIEVKYTNIISDEVVEVSKIEKIRTRMANSNNYRTYYVSADGTSNDGTDINNPMSLKEANAKVYEGNEKVLLKRGDTFYGTLKLKIANDGQESMLYIGSYGSGNKPVISGANILVNPSEWQLVNNQIYRLNMANESSFAGIGFEYNEPFNIGFIEDESGNIHGNRKENIDLLAKEFDFYCEDTYLYVKAHDNPSNLLGQIKLVSRNNLVRLYSNTIFEGIIVQETGAHGITRATNNVQNIYVKNCVIQRIGGSIQKLESFTRYGNGIEFWDEAKNTIVENCIIRDIYDAGYTIQSNTVTTGFYNNICRNNIFINCSYSHEIFCYNKNNLGKGDIKNFKYYGNISINEGRGWGYDARPRKETAAEFTVWTIINDSGTDIKEFNNRSYNPRRLYYITGNTIKRAGGNLRKLIQSHNNSFYTNNDTIMLTRDNSEFKSTSILNQYGLEINSSFSNLISTDLDYIQNKTILNSNNYSEIKEYYNKFDVAYRNRTAITSIVLKNKAIKDNNYGIYSNRKVSKKYDQFLQSASNIISNNKNIKIATINTMFNKQVELVDVILEEFYSNARTYQNKNTTIAIIKDILNITEDYKSIFSYYLINDSIEVTPTITNMINDTIKKYNENVNSSIGASTDFIQKSKDLYFDILYHDDLVDNYLKKLQIMKLCDISMAIIDVDTGNDVDYNRNYSSYVVDEDYIRNIKENTTVISFLNILGLPDNYKVYAENEKKKKKNNIIATGDTIKLNGTYRIVVTGDIYADGEVNVKDLNKLKNKVYNNIELNEFETYAADINSDSIIDENDIDELKDMILNN